MSPNDQDSSLFDALLEKHGYLIGGDDLRRLLAYSSHESFKKACQRGTVPVATFHIPGRRTRFATTMDVAAWLCDQITNAQPVKGDTN